MRRSRSKPTLLIAGLLTGLLMAIVSVPLLAQPVGEPAYDLSKEVTLSGTVSTVLHNAPRGMAWGSHLLMETASGRVDASLGRWALEGKGALSVSVGQQVEVTGIMRTLKDKEVFVARTVKVNGKVYAVRDQHGMSVSPQTRQLAAKKGESL